MVVWYTCVKNLTLVELSIQKRSVCVRESECISKRGITENNQKNKKTHSRGMTTYALKRAILIN